MNTFEELRILYPHVARSIDKVKYEKACSEADDELWAKTREVLAKRTDVDHAKFSGSDYEFVMNLNQMLVRDQGYSAPNGLRQLTPGEQVEIFSEELASAMLSGLTIKPTPGSELEKEYVGCEEYTARLLGLHFRLKLIHVNYMGG